MGTASTKPRLTPEDLFPALIAFGRAHPAIQRIALFGSVARGETTADSDVDVVVKFRPGSLPRSLAGFDFLTDLEAELATRLGCPVDLIEQGAVENARRIGNRALPLAVDRDARTVYESDPTPN